MYPENFINVYVGHNVTTYSRQKPL